MATQNNAAKGAKGNHKLFSFVVNGQTFLFRVPPTSVYASAGFAKLIGGKINPSVKDRKGLKPGRIANAFPRARINFEGGGGVYFFYSPTIAPEKLAQSLSGKKVNRAGQSKTISSVSFPA